MKFSVKTSPKPCKWGEVDKGCPDNGCSESKGVQGFPVGAFVEGELHLSWMQFFPSPFMSFILLFLLLFLQEANQGTLPWRGDQWWQCYPQVLSHK
jgi:hypothetical protein